MLPPFGDRALTTPPSLTPATPAATIVTKIAPSPPAVSPKHSQAPCLRAKAHTHATATATAARGNALTPSTSAEPWIESDPAKDAPAKPPSHEAKLLQARLWINGSATVASYDVFCRAVGCEEDVLSLAEFDKLVTSEARVPADTERIGCSTTQTCSMVPVDTRPLHSKRAGVLEQPTTSDSPANANTISVPTTAVLHASTKEIANRLRRNLRQAVSHLGRRHLETVLAYKATVSRRGETHARPRSMESRCWCRTSTTSVSTYNSHLRSTRSIEYDPEPPQLLQNQYSHPHHHHPRPQRTIAPTVQQPDSSSSPSDDNGAATETMSELEEVAHTILSINSRGRGPSPNIPRG